MSESRLAEYHNAIVYQDEAKRVAKLTLQYPNIETGGSLFGYWTHSGSPVISLASGPGRGSRHNPTSFYQNETYLRDFGIELYDRHGMQHVGEWHSHHRLGVNEPTQGDVNTIHSGMRQRGWSRFLLLITTIEDPEEGLVLESYFLFSELEAASRPLRIVLLPGSSPFRTTECDAKEEPVRPVPQLAWRPGPLTPSIRRAAQDAFPDAWFTSTEGRERLVKIARDFKAVGIDCLMVPREDGRELKLLLGDDALLLGYNFPEKAPEWLGTKRPTNLIPWSVSTDLVKWYLGAKPVERGGRKNELED